MASITCRRGHSNPSSHRFCQECGEKLQPPTSGEPGTVVGDRYRILTKLGRGGFGQTYLVEDIHRFQERCVLKEFAPVDQNPKALEKAKQLFEREAGILYQLQHPQIPRFREWFTAPDGGRLFLVQDYVQGQTYLTLLEQRQQRGKTFSKAEIVQLLLQTLPILEYIHSQGVIHRDLSPDNLILRQGDQLPVLIDFGGVRQITAAPEPRRGGAPVGVPTLLGKPGYAPEEQLRLGQVSPSSDLYALAVTVLVLAIGKEPQAFYDPNRCSFYWRQRVSLSPALGTILDRMLATDPGDRYATATEVLTVLAHSVSGGASTNLKTQIAQLASRSTTHLRTSSTQLWQQLGQHLQTQNRRLKPLARLALIPLVMVIAASLGWWAMRTWLLNRQPFQIAPGASTPATPGFSAAEQTRKTQLFARLEQLQLEVGFFNRLTNEAFYLQYPEQQGRLLTPDPADAPLRQSWDQTGLQVLQAVASLSPAARDRLGTYSRQDLRHLDRYLRTSQPQERRSLAEQRRRFYQAIDAELVQLLPMYRDKDLQQLEAMQIWYALAVDQLQP